MTDMEQDRADRNKSVLAMLGINPQGKQGTFDHTVPIKLEIKIAKAVADMAEQKAAPQNAADIPATPSVPERVDVPITRQTPTGITLSLIRCNEQLPPRHPRKRNKPRNGR